MHNKSIITIFLPRGGGIFLGKKKIEILQGVNKLIPSPRGSGFSVGRRRSLARKFERDVTPVRTRIIQDKVGIGANP